MVMWPLSLLPASFTGSPEQAKCSLVIFDDVCNLDNYFRVLRECETREWIICAK